MCNEPRKLDKKLSGFITHRASLFYVRRIVQSLRTGSEVRPTPSFLKILRSTSLVMTVVCIGDRPAQKVVVMR